MTTEEILTHHLQALGQGDIDGILSDYAEDAILFSPNGLIRGHAAIRAAFEGFVKNSPPELLQAFKIVRQDIDGNIGRSVGHEVTHTQSLPQQFSLPLTPPQSLTQSTSLTQSLSLTNRLSLPHLFYPTHFFYLPLHFLLQLLLFLPHLYLFSLPLLFSLPYTIR